jgi:hypothetical protein
MRVLAIVLLPFVLVFLLARTLLRLLLVPPTLWLLKVSRRLGPLRVPFLILTAPIHLLGLLLVPSTGRMLEGDLLRPMFTLPYAFRRGAWQVAPETDYRKVHLCLGASRLELSIASPLDVLRREDDMARRLTDRALTEPALENGMRWAGMRLTTFGGAPLTCLYFVWRDDAPDESCIFVKFTGDPADEAAADAFVESLMPELPESDGDEPVPTLDPA